MLTLAKDKPITVLEGGLWIGLRFNNSNVEMVFGIVVPMMERNVQKLVPSQIKNSKVLFRKDSNNKWKIQGSTSDTCYIDSLPAFGIWNDIQYNL